MITLYHHPKSTLLPKSKVIEDYARRVTARPAFIRAMAKEGA
jgi:hypothetical protein